VRKLFIPVICVLAGPLLAQSSIPDWCRALPRPEYKNIERVKVSDPWFEVYKPASAVFAIYEPHQAEETIGYLIIGEKRALLFDTGMGISDVRKIVSELTQLPIVVLNSHTHDDHVGGNWQFDKIYGMDTDFTRKNAKGSRDDAQAEITPDQICGSLPKGFDAKAYSTRPWTITSYTHDGDRIDLGGRIIEVIATPGHTPGTLSMIFPVKDRGRTLYVAYSGGTAFNFPSTVPNFDIYIQSQKKMAAAARDANATILMSNHSEFDYATTKIKLLASRKPGEPHPYEVGKDAVARYFTVTEECAQAQRLKVMQMGPKRQ